MQIIQVIQVIHCNKSNASNASIETNASNASNVSNASNASKSSTSVNRLFGKSTFFQVVFLLSHVSFVLLFMHSCFSCIACINLIYLLPVLPDLQEIQKKHLYIDTGNTKKNIYHSLTYCPSDNLKPRDASASKKYYYITHSVQVGSL